VTRRRTDSREQRSEPSPRLDEPSAVRGDGMPADADQPVTGIIGDASVTAGQSRSGEDTRRRGWFWHWNSIVTQFAPIIGLKGVGLLNSYTVWTDRREESPHRGYAFPSQQSEADFYGEDRNELITINKILVALDLIEIRKEMVYRTDERGRRWKVPHNLYRVKDHGDEFNLSTRDVMRVAQLADKDRAVYRYVRRVFSPRFEPIDRDNVWHDILEEVRRTDVWQRLADRTERDEKRASARSKAGHASRRASDTDAVFSLPNDGDNAAVEATAPDTTNDSATGDTNDSGPTSETSAAQTNTGLATSVARSSNGSTPKSPGSDDESNNGPATSVGRTSTTYYQDQTTTTTGESGNFSELASDPVQASPMENSLGLPPDDRRDEDTTVRLFDEANGRPSTPAARRHLKRMAGDVAETAHRAGVSGWALVGSAIDEAVASGSAFVAPKRIREILARWERDGVPADYASEAPADARPSTSGVTPVTRGGAASHRSVRTVALPNGRDAADVWEATCQLLGGELSAADLAALRDGAAVVGYDAGEVMIEATTDATAEVIATREQLVQRKLGVVLRRPVRIRVVAGAPGGPDDPDPDPAPEPRSRERQPRSGKTPARIAPPAAPRAVPVFMVPECGMTSEQIWSAVLDDLRGEGAIPRGEVDTWLRDSALIGRGEGAMLIVGVPHALAERRALRFLPAIEQAAAHIVGFDCAIEIVRTQTWLADRAATGTEG